MSKAILISINPKHVMNILNGKKTIELRKTYPHCALPIDVYIYCTSHKNYHESLYEVCEEDGGGYDVDYYNPCCCEDEDERDFLLNSQVVAKFTLKEIREAKYQPNVDEHTKLANKLTCLNDEEIDKYFGKKDGYGWVIDNLVIFDKPKLLKEFVRYNAKSYPLSALPKTKEKYKEFNSVEDFNKYVLRVTKAPQSWCYVEV